jgi:hypothetical protein
MRYQVRQDPVHACTDTLLDSRCAPRRGAPSPASRAPGGVLSADEVVPGSSRIHSRRTSARGCVRHLSRHAFRPDPAPRQWSRETPCAAAQTRLHRMPPRGPLLPLHFAASAPAPGAPWGTPFAHASPARSDKVMPRSTSWTASPGRTCGPGAPPSASGFPKDPSAGTAPRDSHTWSRSPTRTSVRRWCGGRTPGLPWCSVGNSGGRATWHPWAQHTLDRLQSSRRSPFLDRQCTSRPRRQHPQSPEGLRSLTLWPRPRAPVVPPRQPEWLHLDTSVGGQVQRRPLPELPKESRTRMAPHLATSAPAPSAPEGAPFAGASATRLASRRLDRQPGRVPLRTPVETGSARLCRRSRRTSCCRRAPRGAPAPSCSLESSMVRRFHLAPYLPRHLAGASSDRRWRPRRISFRGRPRPDSSRGSRRSRGISVRTQPPHAWASWCTGWQPGLLPRPALQASRSAPARQRPVVPEDHLLRPALHRAASASAPGDPEGTPRARVRHLSTPVTWSAAHPQPRSSIPKDLRLLPVPRRARSTPARRAPAGARRHVSSRSRRAWSGNLAGQRLSGMSLP